MKPHIYFYLILLPLFLATNGPAQNVLFQEDFATTPITSVWNDLDDTLWTGSSWCAQAARGVASDHNSTDVDFNASQNSGYFLGHNPQDSCNGANTATVVSDSFDFSGVTSLHFSCRYFIGDSIGWGPHTLEIEFMTSSDSMLIDTVFTDTSQWSTIDVALSNSMIDDTVHFEIRMGGGEAFGVDDLMVYEPSTTEIKNDKKASSELMVHPHPFDDVLRVDLMDPRRRKSGTLRLMDIKGRIVYKEPIEGQRGVEVNTSELERGIYILELKGKNGKSSYRKLLKR